MYVCPYTINLGIVKRYDVSVSGIMAIFYTFVSFSKNMVFVAVVDPIGCSIFYNFNVPRTDFLGSFRFNIFNPSIFYFGESANGIIWEDMS